MSITWFQQMIVSWLGQWMPLCDITKGLAHILWKKNEDETRVRRQGKITSKYCFYSNFNEMRPSKACWQILLSKWHIVFNEPVPCDIFFLTGSNQMKGSSSLERPTSQRPWTSMFVCTCCCSSWTDRGRFFYLFIYFSYFMTHFCSVSALIRPGRFDMQVTVPKPDIKGRTEILNWYLKKIKVDPGVSSQPVYN